MKALLAKKLAKEQYVYPASVRCSNGVHMFIRHSIFRNPKFVSPTDKMLTPVSQKLNAAKKKHFDKCVTLI